MPVSAQNTKDEGEEVSMFVPDGDGYIYVQGVKIKVTDPMHVRQTHFKDNWFIGIMGGAYQSWGSFTSKTAFLSKLGPSAAIVVGKDITPISTIRAMLLYGRSTGQVTPDVMPENPDHIYHWHNSALYLSYMPSLTNLFCGYKEDRFLNIKGVVGIGLEQSWDITTDAVDRKKNLDYRHTLFAYSLVGLQAGLHASMRLNDRLHLTLEATENFLDDSYDRNRQQADHTHDGHLNLHLGLTYHLGKNRENRQFVNVVNTLTTLEQMDDTLNNLRNNNKYLVKNPKHIKKEIVSDAEVIYTLIAFDHGSSFVDRMQQTNIYNTAAIWERRKDSNVFICTTSKTDNQLFRDRVDAIKHVLADRYQIPDSQVIGVADEKDIKSLMKGKTAIVFVINDIND